MPPQQKDSAPPTGEDKGKTQEQLREDIVLLTRDLFGGRVEALYKALPLSDLVGMYLFIFTIVFGCLASLPVVASPCCPHVSSSFPCATFPLSIFAHLTVSAFFLLLTSSPPPLLPHYSI